jgi:hypothetical protein
MRKHRKTYIENKKLIRTTMFSLLIVAVLVLSSSVMGIHIQGNQAKVNVKKVVDLGGPSTGLAPGVSSKATNLVAIAGGNSQPLGRGITMYAYNAYASGMTNGPCYFDTETPGDITKLSEEVVTNFMAGGTWTCDEQWLCVQYGTGVLYSITTDTGEITTIGGGGVNLNGLAYDPTTNLMYGAGDTALYLVNSEDGTQEVVGSFGGGVMYMIGMAFDADGVLYGWDLNDYLWTIDTSSGLATQVGPLGINLNYAQDGDFDRENDVLYLTAYTLSPNYGGYLYTCDKTSGATTLVGAFEASAELDGSMIINGCIPPEHDVGVKSINKPQDGPGYAPIPVQVTVKNSGNNSETTDVQFEIIKCEQGPALYGTDFSGDFPPVGWTTFGYHQSYSNFAGGISPEAAYTYYPYYDSMGWIMSPPIDATGYEKINLIFHLYGDFAGYSGTFFYLQYRKNATAPWRDASPWENPVSGDLGPAEYTIGCYGWGEPIGDAFQAQWLFGNYYYYLQYNSGIYLDDANFYGCAGCAEYSDLVEDVEVPFDQSVQVDFASWTPTEWHNPLVQNSWEDYPLSAYTTLVDNNQKNNRKNVLLHLYYPWLHDVGTISYAGPEDGPAQTFPVTAQVQNTGQYDECCFKAYAEISQFGTDQDLLIDQSFPSCYPWPPTGWTTTHPSNWQCSYSSQAGGTYPELIFYYYPSSTDDFRFISPAMDTTGYGSIKIDFKHYVNHYTTPYTLKVETSTDLISWSTVWSIDPTSSGGGPVTIMTGDNVGTTTYVAWTLSGNSYNINYWYIDDIVINGIAVTPPEYSDNVCIDALAVGEIKNLEFADWTPAFLAMETSGQVSYSLKIWTDMTSPPDNNQANNMISTTITLDFFHDVAVEVSSPILEKGNKLLWDNGDTDGTNGYSIYNSLGRSLLDDFELTQSAKLSEYHAYMIFPSGSPATGWSLKFRSDDSGSPGDVVATSNTVSLTSTLTGRYWFGYAEYETVYMFDPILLGAGIWWCEDTNGPSDPNCYQMVKSTIWGSECWVNYQDYGGMFPGSQVFGVQADLSFQLWGGAGASVYVPLGTQDIEGLGLNLGTFPETGMTAYAAVNELLTDCEVPTLLQSYQIDNVNILTPLVGTVPLPFGTYTFTAEGPYLLTMSLVDDNDDFTDNNYAEWGIGVDNTPPTSTRTLSPAAPDGDNNWYVSDLTVTLDAADPTIGCDWSGSGVKEIKYTVNSVPGTITGDHGTFKITADGNDIAVQYWAIDNVGNIEAKHTFSIDMDQTKPVVPEVIIYEAFQGDDNKWYVTFNVTCTDATSIMNRVEWALNDVVQNTVLGAGPIYTWTVQWSADLQLPTVTFKATAYDTAGNSDFVTITGDQVQSLAEPQQFMQKNSQPVLKILQQKLNI